MPVAVDKLSLSLSTDPEISLLVPDDDVSDPEISIVIPALNERITIVEFLKWSSKGYRRPAPSEKFSSWTAPPMKRPNSP